MNTIFIAYGHGGVDAGAVHGMVKEKDLNLETGLCVARYLRDIGYKVIEYRKTDTDFGLNSSERIIAATTQAINAKADYFLDIHHNSSNGTGYGVECYYSMSGSGQELATSICKEVESIGFRNRGAKTKIENGEDYFGVIRRTQKYMHANLLECAFIDNQIDLGLMGKLGIDKMAAAIAQGIFKILGAPENPNDNDMERQRLERDRIGLFLPLWEGQWKIGEQITIPHFDKYNLFSIEHSGRGTSTLAIRQSNLLRGIGGYISGGNSPTNFSYHFGANINNNTLTLIAEGEVQHLKDSNAVKVNSTYVRKIYGIL